jgi:prolyl-tRNA editing enzyme YbaK/EbsC (Cys-tRNA(Pro) deacylase)
MLLEHAVDPVGPPAMQREAVVDQLAMAGDRVATSGEREIDVHLAGRGKREVLGDRLRRSSEPSRGCVISGFDETRASR